MPYITITVILGSYQAQVETLSGKGTYLVDTVYMDHCPVCMHHLLNHHSIHLEMLPDQSHLHRFQHPGSM